MSAPSTDSHRRDFPTPEPITLSVRNPAGDIDVRAAETATTTVELWPGADARRSGEAVDRAQVHQSADGRTVTVEIPDRHGRSATVTVRILLPTGSVVTLASASADIGVIGTVAEAKVRTASGDVRIEHITGEASMKTASGDVTIDRIDGDAVLNTASGDLNLGTVGGSCQANTASGDVRIGVAGSDCAARTASGDIEIGSASAGRAQAHAVSGDVTVGVAAGVVTWLDVSTLSGDARSLLDDIPDAPADGPTLELSVRTVSGDITVRRSAQPAGSAA